MLLSLSCKILQLKLFFSTLSTFKSKMTITGTLTITGPFTLFIYFELQLFLLFIIKIFIMNERKLLKNKYLIDLGNWDFSKSGTFLKV